MSRLEGGKNLNNKIKMGSSFVRSVKELYVARDVLSQLIAQQLILRYRRTLLGYLWTLINPLVMMTIMALVFSTLFGADLQTFTIFLFSAMIPWNYFNSVVTQSAASFINNEGLIKKIYLPKAIFPSSITLALLVDSGLSFVALLLIISVLGAPITWALLFLPISYFLLLVFTLGISLIISVATVFFRDLQHVILIAMQALFFLSPILYKPESLTGKVAWLMAINPIVPFIELFRAPLHEGVLPPFSSAILAAGLAILSMFLGVLVFHWKEKSIVFRL